MRAAELRLSYRSDSELDGQLCASVRSGAFAGEGAAWFDPMFLKESFIAKLNLFPIPESDPPTIEGGFWSKNGSNTLEQCHLRLVIRPYNSRGSLLVRVDLAPESWTDPDKDQQQQVTARFLTDYSSVAEFALGLEQLLDGLTESVVLRGLPEGA